MKKQLRIIIAGLCLLAVMCWWLWQSTPAPRTAQTPIAPAPPTATQPPAVTTSPEPTSSPGATPDPRSKEEVMSKKLATLNDQPIDFYGRVVDQRGAPVAGANVRGGVMVEKVWMGGKFVDHYTVTDAAGNFSFRGLRGAEIVIQPTKEGYEFKADINRNFFYSLLHRDSERHHPDPSAPEVFTMWKLNGAEPLSHVRFDRVGVPVNGTPTSFDLLTGKKLPSGGDVILKVERQPEHIQRGQRFDWKAVIEVPGGGIAELNDAYPNEAPADGYEAQFTIEMPATSKEWQTSVTRSFYVKARDGKLYARLMLRITADYEPPPTGVTLEAFINPSGSRNLEYDPAKQASSP